MSPPYPTADEIKTIFEIENGPNPNREEYLSHFDDKFEARAVSDSCPFPKRVDKAGFAAVMEMQEKWMDPAHHYDRHVGIVTGGENNEWAAVELVNSGKTIAGTTFSPPPFFPFFQTPSILNLKSLAVPRPSTKPPSNLPSTSRSRIQRPIPSSHTLYPATQNHRDESLPRCPGTPRDQESCG